MKKISIFILFLFALSNSSIAQNTVKATDILEKIKQGKDITLNNSIIYGELDLTYMQDALPNLPKRSRWWNNGGSNTVEKQITSKLVFTNCTFKNNVLAYIPHEKSGYTFISNFEDEISFKNCTFEAKAMFKYSNFEEDTNFSNTNFKDDNTFKYAIFHKNISFKNTTFKEASTFKYAKFKRFVSFKNSVFKDNATFKYAVFKKGVSFNSTNFKDELNIKYTKVYGTFDITNMKVAYDIDSKYTSINGKSFSKFLLSNR